VSATASVDSPIQAAIKSLPPEERACAREFFKEWPAAEGAPVAVVIPAFNEEPTVGSVVSQIPRKICGLDAEVIVVDDGSADRTAQEALAAGALVCRVPVNRGQGAAFKIGYWLAAHRGCRIVATTDADAQYEEAELEHVVAPIVAGDADFVNGSRRLGTQLNTDRTRRMGVLLFGALISVLTRQKITDPASGVRAFRVEVSNAITLRQPQYQAAEVLISTAAHGFKMIEVGTTMRDRPEGATLTKKGPNLLYGMRFARAILLTFNRERKAARTRGRS
jgi:glycosyltransferase involved in cell wall biosynthesis